MSTLFENRDRRVIPNFRNLKKTIQLGELSIAKSEVKSNTQFDIKDYLDDFKTNQDIIHAGELLSAAVVASKFEDPLIKSAANLIKSNHSIATNIQITLSNKVLGITQNTPIQKNIDTIDDFLENNSLPIIYARLNTLKKIAYRFPKNPFAYTELARVYSIIGQKEASVKNILVAKHLAPNNRYILRSFARLMAHYNELDIAHDVLRKNPTTKFDPWLVASEISLASLKKKTSNFIKHGKELVSSNKFTDFSISELASSLATLELFDGSRKKSKELFRTALLSPNDNSLAQVEWANNKADLFDLDIKKFRVDNNSEAITLDSFNSNDWLNTLKYAEKWFIDMPFAKRPIMFAHHSASFRLEDHATAVKFCKAGLIANPDDHTIINNIAYSYAMLEEPNTAFEYLNKIRMTDIADDHTKICLLATIGLSHYRANNIPLGRKFYYDSMNLAKQLKKVDYLSMAFLNFAREEIKINSPEAKDIFQQAMEIKSADDSEEISIMKQRLKSIFDKKMS